MAIFKDSRYEYVPVYNHFFEETTKRIKSNMVPTLRRRQLPLIATTEAVTHTFTMGDRIDLIAYKYYGDAQLWWVILDSNPKYTIPFDIKIGDVLIIPPLESVIVEGEL